MSSDVLKVSMRRILIASLCAGAFTHIGNAVAGGTTVKPTAPLKEGVPYLFVVHQGKSIKVERDIFASFTTPASVRASLIHTAGVCPPFCLQPIKLDIPVETVAEVEVVDFMATTLRDDKGVLIDVRGETAHAIGTIPGSVNFPITIFKKAPDAPEFIDLLEALGAKPRGEVSQLTRIMEDTGLTDNELLSEQWDFSDAKELIVWSEGAMSGTAPDAARALVEAGYPASKIRWYRGGMPAWLYFGFTVYESELPKKKKNQYKPKGPM